MKYFTENRYTSSVIILSVITAFLGNVLEPLVIYLLSWAILIYFMLEACFKLRKLGWKGYIGHAGNRFDFLVAQWPGTGNEGIQGHPYLAGHPAGLLFTTRFQPLWHLPSQLLWKPNECDEYDFHHIHG